MTRTTTTAAVVAALTTCALMLPLGASARATTTPNDVAWQIKSTANKNLAFTGSKVRLVSTTCASRGGGLYVCRGALNTGGGIYWPTVSAKNGYVKFSGGVSL
jgi:hypothetical protein